MPIQVRQITGKGCEQDIPAKDKDAAIPVVSPCCHKLPGPVQGGLLDKPGGPVNFPLVIQGSPLLDVAIARLRSGGGNAEGHQVAGLGPDGAQVQGLEQTGLVPDEMIGREHRHEVLLGLLFQVNRGQPHRRGGIPPLGFNPDADLVPALAVQFLVNKFGLAGVGHHRQTLGGNPREQAFDGGLQHGFRVQQAQDLLGVLGAAQGPKPGPPSPGQNYAIERNCGGINHGCFLP